jgi:hypothetical protein
VVYLVDFNQSFCAEKIQVGLRAVLRCEWNDTVGK